MTKHAEHSQAVAVLPRGLLLLSGLLLLWVYTYRISTNPLTWEEPRRCLVALEMIYRGDYIVPYVLGEPYRNKPPLQNWLIILLAGNNPDHVGPFVIRSISTLSLLGIACCLFWLSPSTKYHWSRWTPALTFLTMGIVIQYGRSGEIDPLFTFWIMMSFFCFELGRRRRSSWLQWFLSQALLAGGILTKVLAPVFFYPPVLWCAWKDRERSPFPIKTFVLGLVTEILLVCAWLIPYSLHSSASSLGERWTQEILQRTPFWNGAEEFLKHLLFFPVEVLGTMLPWSVVCCLWLVPAVRRHVLQGIRMDPFLRLAATSALWSFGILWIMTGAKGRYLFPCYPLLAVLIAWTLETPLPGLTRVMDSIPARLLSAARDAFIRRGTGWVKLSLLWAIGLVLASLPIKNPALWQPLLTGMAAIALTGYVVVRESRLRPFPLLFLIALLYGIFYAGVTGVRKAEREQRKVDSAQMIAASIPGSLPIVCDRNVAYRDCYMIIKAAGRLVQREPPSQGPYVLVTSLAGGVEIYGPAVAEAPPLGVWKITNE